MLGKEGQAGANQNSALRDEPEAFCLRFGSQKDALNFGRHSAENSRSWCERQTFDFAYLYCHSEAEIIVRLSIGVSGYSGLVFFTSPAWDDASRSHAHTTNTDREFGLSNDRSDRLENAVFGPVGELVKTPDGWIPSFGLFATWGG